MSEEAPTNRVEPDITSLPINQLWEEKRVLEETNPCLKGPTSMIPDGPDGVDIFKKHREVREEILHRVRKADSFSNVA